MRSPKRMSLEREGANKEYNDDKKCEAKRKSKFEKKEQLIMSHSAIRLDETRTEKWPLGRARLQSLVTLMSKMVDETWLEWIEWELEKRIGKTRNMHYTAECPRRSNSTWEDYISTSWTSDIASPCLIFPICKMQVIIRTIYSSLKMWSQIVWHSFHLEESLCPLRWTLSRLRLLQPIEYSGNDAPTPTSYKMIQFLSCSHQHSLLESRASI